MQNLEDKQSELNLLKWDWKKMTEFNLVVISIFSKSWFLITVKPPISPSHKLKLSKVLIQSIVTHFW